MRGALRIGLLIAAVWVAGCGGDDEQAADPATDTEAEWSYAGATGPERWADLDPAYRACSEGRRQSPIDLAGARAGELAPLDFSYRPGSATRHDSGHAIEVLMEGAGGLSSDGIELTLVNYHFHVPSEHRIDGRAYPGEMHLVHAAPDDSLAVIAVFLDEGEENAPLTATLSGIAESPGAERELGSEVDPLTLLPDEGSGPVYRYEGSLTTPPCTEGVVWTVYERPVEISSEQLAELSTAYEGNARPLQPRNARALTRAEAQAARN